MIKGLPLNLHFYLLAAGIQGNAAECWGTQGTSAAPAWPPSAITGKPTAPAELTATWWGICLCRWTSLTLLSCCRGGAPHHHLLVQDLRHLWNGWDRFCECIQWTGLFQCLYLPLITVQWGGISGGVMYLVFTCMPNESHHRWLRSLLLVCETSFEYGLTPLLMFFFSFFLLYCSQLKQILIKLCQGSPGTKSFLADKYLSVSAFAFVKCTYFCIDIPCPEVVLSSWL